MNGTVLEYIHGNGAVWMQLLWTVQAQKHLRTDVNQKLDLSVTLLHSEWPKLHRVLAILSAIGVQNLLER